MLGPCQRKKSIKPHVRTACVNCKKAHLACDAERPCKRCISVGKTDSCYDIQHKKRGRPKLREKYASSLLTASNNSSSSIYNAIPKRPVSRQTHTHFQPMLPLTLPSPPLASTSTPLVRQHHQLTSSPIDSLAPFLAVSPPSSSFVMTKPTTTKPAYDFTGTETTNDAIMTLFLTTEMCCARASDETMDFIGYHPQELAHRSLYDFISNPADLHKIHQQLTQQSLHSTNTNGDLPSSSTNNDYYHQMPPTTLLNIANGSKTFKMTLYFNMPSKESMALSAQFYFGGGLGADLCQPSTLDQLYIVCLLTKPKVRSSSMADTTSSKESSIPSPLSPPLMNLMNDMQNVMTDLSSFSCLSSSLSSTYSSASSNSSSSHITPTSIPPTSSLMMTPPYSTNQTHTALDHEESSLYSWLDFAFSPLPK